MKPVVYLCDAIVDVVDSEMYLGNKLYNNIYWWTCLWFWKTKQSYYSYVFYVR